MRILHVIPSIAPRYGGPSQAVVEMCRALQEAGAQVLIATTNADGDGVMPVVLEQETLYEGVPIIFFSRQWSEAYKYSRPLARWLEAHAGGFDALHVHAVFSHACLAAARVAQKACVPYIVRPLGTLDPWSLKQKRARKQLFWYLGVRRMLQGAAAIHYTAQAERELAEAALGLKNGVVIPLGLSGRTSDFADAPPLRDNYPSLGKHPYILALSRLHHKKGQDLLLEAFLAATKETDLADWRLVLAGDGASDYKEKLQRIVREARQSDRVVFTGWLEGASKQAALRDAALLALPSHQENFGLCVIEAAAYGVPALVSPYVNLAPDIKATGSGWISELQIETLRQTLVEAMRSPTDRQVKGIAARQWATRFSWPEIAQELLALYAGLTPRKLAA